MSGREAALDRQTPSARERDAPDAGPEPAAVDTLSRSEARRIALAAQGFSGARPAGRSDWRRIAPTIDRMQLLQLDSVNALTRSHYLPVFSRIGHYARPALDRRAFAARGRTFFEYWAHEASLLPLGLHPLLRWRMARAERLDGVYRGIAALAREKPRFVAAVLDEVRARGPVSARELEQSGERSGAWWGWHDGKIALEYLFWAGAVTTAERRGFERVYDLTERVIPPEILALPTPPEAEAIRALVRRAGESLGVATLTDLRDYFRLPPDETRQAVAALAEEGALLPVRVEGWGRPAWLAAGAAAPARVMATALLSPFDPLVWERHRAERLFGFRYRIEIYTPAHKRQYGYYVLPFLMNGHLVGRVDLRSDREAGVLRVVAAHGEPASRPDRVAPALAAELALMAEWLGLHRVDVAPSGSLAPALAVASAS